MKKKSIAMLLAAALMLSLCCGSVFAQEKGSEEMEDVLDSAFIDSGEVENPEQQPHTNFTQKEGVVAKEAEVDVEALLAARNADIDIEALQEEALKLCQLKRNVKEQYLSQLSEEELQQIQERTEETLALFEDRAEEAAAVYEESASEQEVMSTMVKL